jgi:hypothetical protein
MIQAFNRSRLLTPDLWKVSTPVVRSFSAARIRESATMSSTYLYVPLLTQPEGLKLERTALRQTGTGSSWPVMLLSKLRSV